MSNHSSRIPNTSYVTTDLYFLLNDLFTQNTKVFYFAVITLRLQHTNKLLLSNLFLKQKQKKSSRNQENNKKID